MTSCPEDLDRLISDYTRNAQGYLKANYNEQQTREELINRLFEFLGWDVTNKSRFSQNFKDVLHEESVKVGGETKAPDYTFRIGGSRVFFVEAKKPSIDIDTDPEPAYQLRRYAWSAKLPISILTNFRQFAVYDTRIRPSHRDKPSTARVHFIKYEDYTSKWDLLFSLLSKDAILKGALDRFALDEYEQRGTSTVNSEFLKDIETWRNDLAKAIALDNPKLDTNDLNFIVQQTIDRIVFLRICEDRGIEPQGLLRNRLKNSKIYKSLFEIFERADEKYNSGLFHFIEDPKRTEPADLLSAKVKIDNVPLHDIISSIYYPSSPYEFSVIPAEILGQVYEQFLGRVIRLTPTHRAVVEEKPEVKKAGGVFYTPNYVVEFVVGLSLDAALKGKNLKEVKNFRIIDPSCGSGSFLIVAYERLLRWHLDWYLSHKSDATKSVIYDDQSGNKHLTIAERKRILKSNIFGVDLDVQAVEVTKLSLHLKVLEGETERTLGTQLRLFNDRALPDLGANIKRGNALVEPDILGLTKFSIGTVVSETSPFEWSSNFPFIAKGQKFDVVIGNPPWGADVSESERVYLKERYQRVLRRIPDSYLFFIDKFLRLTNPNGGHLGIVLPSTLLNQHDAILARDLLCDNGIDCVVNLGPGVFGKKVLNTTTVLSCTLGSVPNEISIKDLSKMQQFEKPKALGDLSIVSRQSWLDLVRSDPEHTFFVGDIRAAQILDKARKANPNLNDILDEDGIQRGVSPDLFTAHVVTKEQLRAERLEPECIRPSISGEQIKPYKEWKIDQYIIYIGKNDEINLYPNAEQHIANYRKEMSCPEVKQRKHPWWALHRKRDPRIFQSPKFIGLTTSKTVNLIYDGNDSLVVTDAMFVFHLKHEIDPDIVLAIMQSSPFLFFYRVANQGESRVIPQLKAAKLEPLPFPLLKKGDDFSAKIKSLVERAIEIGKVSYKTKDAVNKTALHKAFDSILIEIDSLVCDAYGLSQEDSAYIKSWLTAKPAASRKFDAEAQ